MDKQEEKSILHQALNKYGVQAQKMMLFEECGELVNAVAKFDRGRAGIMDIITELADVSIMVDQMVFVFGDEELFSKERERKLLRLKERIEKK